MVTPNRLAAHLLVRLSLRSSAPQSIQLILKTCSSPLVVQARSTTLSLSCAKLVIAYLFPSPVSLFANQFAKIWVLSSRPTSSYPIRVGTLIWNIFAAKSLHAPGLYLLTIPQTLAAPASPPSTSKKFWLSLTSTKFQ